MPNIIHRAIFNLGKRGRMTEIEILKKKIIKRSFERKEKMYLAFVKIPFYFSAKRVAPGDALVTDYTEAGELSVILNNNVYRLATYQILGMPEVEKLKRNILKRAFKNKRPLNLCFLKILMSGKLKVLGYGGVVIKDYKGGGSVTISVKPGSEFTILTSNIFDVEEDTENE